MYQEVRVQTVDGSFGWLRRWRIQRIRSRFEERLRERERIARELHDTFLQSVQALALVVQDVATRMRPDDPMRDVLANTLAHADRVTAEGRDRIQGLRARAPTDLAQALAATAVELVADHRVELRFLVDGQPRAVEPAVADEVALIAREALRNALTHARADTVEVQLIYAVDELRLQIRDDGTGFAPEALHADGATRHWGIAGMRERAQAVAGRLDVWSRAGAGTEIDLRVSAVTAYCRAKNTVELPAYGPCARSWRQRAFGLPS